MTKNGKATLANAAAILIGIPLAAGGMAMFTIPNDIAPGGVSGLATALAAVFPASVGALSLALNIPIFFAAKRVLGWKKLLLTAIAAAYFSVLLDLFMLVLPAYTGDRLLASVCGGAVCGAGLGIIMIRGITSGGTDLLALALREPFPYIPAGTLLVAIDAAVVAAAVLIFRNIEVALYSVITIYVQGKVIDALTQGVNYAKVVLIITDKPRQIMDVLVDEHGRGMTEFAVKGGYTGQPRSLLMTVLRRAEAAEALRVAKTIDPRAFIIVHSASEIHGEGFIEAAPASNE